MNLIKEFERLIPEIKKNLEQASSLEHIEQIRIAFLGRKGQLAVLMSQLPKVDAALRPTVGEAANEVKNQLNKLISEHKNQFDLLADTNRSQNFDSGLPGKQPWSGTLHPITIVLEEICSVFSGLGYSIVTGPEVETEYHNFEALGIPAEHPARDMQDTFYISDSILLRTHTSSIQIRTMLKKQPPIAIIAPGRVYRRDSDVTHTPMFHQIEGLVVEKNISMAHLRGTLTAFLKTIFGTEIKIRFRPSFFPFTEPSAEMDISCHPCSNTGYIKNEICRICKGTGWLEILGCGMVHPNVFESVGYDHTIYTGFAFGLGIERIAMLKYHIGDLRIFFENDLRFLRQFMWL